MVVKRKGNVRSVFILCSSRKNQHGRYVSGQTVSSLRFFLGGAMIANICPHRDGKAGQGTMEG